MSAGTEGAVRHFAKWYAVRVKPAMNRNSSSGWREETLDSYPAPHYPQVVGSSQLAIVQKGLRGTKDSTIWAALTECQKTMPGPLNIEEAVRAALDFFQRMYGDKGLKDVLLEEVREGDENTWEVTVGYSRLLQDVGPLAAVTQAQMPKYERVYKVLAVDKSTGAVTSMVLRTV